jgi:hypothetical protein
MFFTNPFAGFRDPNDPYGLLQMAAASAAPGFTPVPSPMRTDATSDLTGGATDERRVPLPPTARKQPEVTTNIVGPTGQQTVDERRIPTAASQATAAGSWWDRVMAASKDPRFAPAISALAKGMGTGAGAPPIPTARAPQIAAGNPGYHHADTSATMNEIRKKLATFGPRPKRQRTDDPHDREQDTYDFRRMKRGM